MFIPHYFSLLVLMLLTYFRLSEMRSDILTVLLKIEVFWDVIAVSLGGHFP